MTRTLRQSLGALVLAGLSMGLAACDESSTSSSPKDITTPDQKAAFRAECEKAGGMLHETSCNGTSECAGLYLNGETGKIDSTTCKGTNTCAGIQCLEPTPLDTAAAKAKLLAATTVNTFVSACKSARSQAVSDTTCSGHNTCAGVRFLVATATTEQTECAGHGSCKGLTCPL